MFKKGTKLFSVVKLKCPQCHEGTFFEGHPYNYSTMGEVKELCSECNLKYSKEPGFYHGSFYVTYGLSVALFVTVWVLMLIMFPESGPIAKILAVVGSLFALAPLLYALSKIIWANMFFHYKEKW